MKPYIFVLAIFLFGCSQEASVEVRNNLSSAHGKPIGSATIMEKNDTQVLYYEEYKEAIRFIFEDIGDTTDNGNEYIVLSVDFNQNGIVDKGSGLIPREQQQHLDHEFSVTRDRDYLCSVLLYSPAASSTCGGFLSEATYRKDFVKTGNGKTEHIYWEMTVPKSELVDKPSNEAHLVVKFNRGNQGVRTYPVQKGPLFSSVFVVKWAQQYAPADAASGMPRR